MDAELWVKAGSTLLVAVIGWLLKYRFEGRAKLVYFLIHSSAIPLPPPTPMAPSPARWPWLQRLAQHLAAPAQPALAPIPPSHIHTHAMIVRNVGKRTAHNVRIGHANFPFSYSMHPPLNHQLVRFGPAAEIIIPTLVAQEEVSISYLYFPPLLWSNVVGPVKCDEGLAKAVKVIPSTPWPRPFTWALWIAAFVGASSIVAGAFWFVANLLAA